MKSKYVIALIVVFSLILYSCAKNENPSNENPPAISDQVFSLEENSPEGTVIGTVVAHDRDEGQILSYEIVEGNNDATFVLDPASGIYRWPFPGTLIMR